MVARKVSRTIDQFTAAPASPLELLPRPTVAPHVPPDLWEHCANLRDDGPAGVDLSARPECQELASKQHTPKLFTLDQPSARAIRYRVCNPALGGSHAKLRRVDAQVA
jgi:hypothetical protein